MSHDPSANRGVRAIQVDINGLSPVSDDITTHTKTTFSASSVYFIDHRYFITTSSSGSGRIVNTNFSGSPRLSQSFNDGGRKYRRSAFDPSKN